MPADRPRTEVPPLVTHIVGIVVALVSGVFGISAHGLAAGSAAAAPTTGQILTVAAVSAGIGAVTATLAQRRSPVRTAAAGLLAGQGLVHLVLSAGHAGAGHTYAGRASGAAATGTSAHLGHHAADPAAVRAAMDSAASAGAALLTPAMLGAHLAAIVITLALVAALSGALSWVAERVVPMFGRVRGGVVVVPLLTPYHADTPPGRHHFDGGGTRAPPIHV